MASVFPSKQAVVVGGGLAGMSAANTVLENGGAVVLLDKSAFCGGNSTKATSGINGAETKTQRAKGIPDTIALFTSDTIKGGAKKPELAMVLCGNSGADVDWLVEKFNLDLSLVARLGGHSQPRTHRGAERFPGMTITYALIQMLEKISEKNPDKARIVTKARAKKLLMNNNACVGLVYEKGGQDFQEHGPVIFASGGFGADFAQDSLLAQYRPDLLHLPTTNGEHCTGDAIKMGNAVGAKTIDLEWVQVHPTGLVKPDDPDAKIKFLAAEALRGVGGIVLNAAGKRFANELGRRDYVTGEMWKNTPPFRLCLNKAASDEIIWHCKHYTGRGVMKSYANGKALADDMGVSLDVLVKTHEEHYQAAKKTEKDPDGGSFPAYPSGKSWDEASGKTGSGKKFYHNIIDGSKVAAEPFYVAIITPVIHYCMGGLEVDVNSACIGANGKAIPGLYAAGEVAGGVHGNNRLGGNSLLDCVVFGRVAGAHCANYMLGDVVPTDLVSLSGGGLSGTVESSKLAGGSYEDKMNTAGGGGTKTVTAGGGGGTKAAAGGGGGGGAKIVSPAKAQAAQQDGGCFSCFFGPSNSAAKLRHRLIKIDLLKTSAEAEIEELFIAAHSTKQGKSAEAYGPVTGSDYRILMKAVQDYCYGEYAEAKKARLDDIVHPSEIDVIKSHIKESLDPENNKQVTLASMRLSLKKLVDDTDYNED
jgi:flavocytochrome c